MLILDTDHLTAIDRATASGAVLRSRLASREDEFCTTVVSISEQLSGLLALISSARSDHETLDRYGRLSKKLGSLQDFRLLDWTDAAAGEFHKLRRKKLRIGTMDLRIASIALSNNATLLTANVRDFEKVPGLRVENWLAE